MLRRRFLGLLTGAVAAGPKAVAAAAEPTMASLKLRGLGITGSGGEAAAAAPPIGPDGVDYHLRWAKEQLGKITGLSKRQHALQERTFHIEGLDANTGALRSVSLVNKVRISRAFQYRQTMRNRKTYLGGTVAGWWTSV